MAKPLTLEKGTSVACSQKISVQRQKLKKSLFEATALRIMLRFISSRGVVTMSSMSSDRYQHSEWMRTYPGAWVRISFIMNNALITADTYKVTRPASTHLKKEMWQVGVITLSCDGQNNTLLAYSLSSSVPHENIWGVDFTRRETGWRTGRSDSSLSDRECSTFQAQQLSASTDTECTKPYVPLFIDTLSVYLLMHGCVPVLKLTLSAMQAAAFLFIS